MRGLIELYLHFTKKKSYEVWVENVNVSKDCPLRPHPHVYSSWFSVQLIGFKRFVNINCFAYKVLQKYIIFVFQKLKKEKKRARYKEKERKVKLDFENLFWKSFVLCTSISVQKCWECPDKCFDNSSKLS